MPHGRSDGSSLIEGLPNSLRASVTTDTLRDELEKMRFPKRIIRRALAGRIPVPDHEQLNRGDIILHTPTTAKELEKHPVAKLQKEKGHADSFQWVHASIYVGELRVVESQKREIKKPRGGVQIASLLKYAAERKFMVVRPTDDRYTQARERIVATSLLEPNANPRQYDVIRAIGIWWNEWRSRNGIKRKVLSKLPSNFQKAVFCSEYVLERLALFGEVLIDEYYDVIDDETDTYFHPCLFAERAGMRVFQVNNLQIED